MPSLELTLTTLGEQQRSWHSDGGPPEWRGRLGDGRELTIERGAQEDLLFSYREPAPSGDALASFRLHSGMRRLDCASRARDLSWQQALIGKVLPAISVMRGYEALHAAAVQSTRGAVAIMAGSGAGKSTLAAELLHRGWPLIADDVLALDCESGAVRAHPGSPHLNLSEPLPDTLDPEDLGTTLAMLSGERWLAARAVAEGPQPVHAICLLQRGAGLPLRAQALPASPLPLAPYILGLADDPARQRERFGLYADLMETARLLRLTAGPEDGPGQIADLLETELALARPLVGAR